MMAASNKCTTSGKSILFANLFSSKCRAELRQVEVVLSMERNRLSLHFERGQAARGIAQTDVASITFCLLKPKEILTWWGGTLAIGVIKRNAH